MKCMTRSLVDFHQLLSGKDISIRILDLEYEQAISDRVRIDVPMGDGALLQQFAIHVPYLIAHVACVAFNDQRVRQR